MPLTQRYLPQHTVVNNVLSASLLYISAGAGVHLFVSLFTNPPTHAGTFILLLLLQYRLVFCFSNPKYHIIYLHTELFSIPSISINTDPLSLAPPSRLSWFSTVWFGLLRNVVIDLQCDEVTSSELGAIPDPNAVTGCLETHTRPPEIELHVRNFE